MVWKRKDVPNNNCGNIKEAKKGKMRELLEEYDYTLLNKIDNIEFESIIKETLARKMALELDLLSNAELVKSIKEFGVSAFKDEMDLVELKSKSADLIKNTQFYKIELTKLKEKYLDASDEEKVAIMEQMEFFERQIERYNNAYNKIKALTAKIRSSIMRRKKWEQEQKEKQQDMDKDIIDLSDVDFDNLEDE